MCSKTWICINPNCKATVSWSYDDLVEYGSPYCAVCDDDMKLLKTNEKGGSNE